MISIFHYFDSKKRLAESIKTIGMMGGEDECQPMLLGQRDFLELEVQYHKESMQRLLTWVLSFAIMAAITLVCYVNFFKG